MPPVTARKKWRCDYCGEDINPGEKYLLEEGRAPVFDSSDNQCGIEYYKSRTCFDVDSCIKRYEKQECVQNELNKRNQIVISQHKTERVKKIRKISKTTDLDQMFTNI